MSASVVREMLDVLNEEGVEAALPWFAEDFHGVVPPELSGEPDIYRGHDGLRRYFGSFTEVVDDLRFDAEELVEIARDAVAARGLITGRGRESGIPVEMRVPMLIRLRDRLVVEMSAHPDWDAMVMGASEPR